MSKDLMVKFGGDMLTAVQFRDHETIEIVKHRLFKIKGIRPAIVKFVRTELSDKELKDDNSSVSVVRKEILTNPYGRLISGVKGRLEGKSYDHPDYEWEFRNFEKLRLYKSTVIVPKNEDSPSRGNIKGILDGGFYGPLSIILTFMDQVEQLYSLLHVNKSFYECISYSLDQGHLRFNNVHLTIMFGESIPVCEKLFLKLISNRSDGMITKLRIDIIPHQHIINKNNDLFFHSHVRRRIPKGSLYKSSILHSYPKVLDELLKRTKSDLKARFIKNLFLFAGKMNCVDCLAILVNHLPSHFPHYQSFDIFRTLIDHGKWDIVYKIIELKRNLTYPYFHNVYFAYFKSSQPVIEYEKFMKIHEMYFPFEFRYVGSHPLSDFFIAAKKMEWKLAKFFFDRNSKICEMEKHNVISNMNERGFKVLVDSVLNELEKRGEVFIRFALEVGPGGLTVRTEEARLLLYNAYLEKNMEYMYEIFCSSRSIDHQESNTNYFKYELFPYEKENTDVSLSVLKKSKIFEMKIHQEKSSVLFLDYRSILSSIERKKFELAEFLLGEIQPRFLFEFGNQLTMPIVTIIASLIEMNRVEPAEKALKKYFPPNRSVRKFFLEHIKPISIIYSVCLKHDVHSMVLYCEKLLGPDFFDVGSEKLVEMKSSDIQIRFIRTMLGRYGSSLNDLEEKKERIMELFKTCSEFYKSSHDQPMRNNSVEVGKMLVKEKEWDSDDYLMKHFHQKHLPFCKIVLQEYVTSCGICVRNDVDVLRESVFFRDIEDRKCLYCVSCYDEFYKNLMTSVQQY